MTGLEAYEIVKEECSYTFGQTSNGDRVRECLPIIEKELKALSMICNHDVLPSDIIMCKDYDAYMFKRDYQEGWTLSKEQFDFLKGVLNEIL